VTRNLLGAVKEKMLLLKDKNSEKWNAAYQKKNLLEAYATTSLMNGEIDTYLIYTHHLDRNEKLSESIK